MRDYQNNTVIVTNINDEFDMSEQRYEHCSLIQAKKIAREQAANSDNRVYIERYRKDGQRMFYNDGIGWEPVGKAW